MIGCDAEREGSALQRTSSADRLTSGHCTRHCSTSPSTVDYTPTRTRDDDDDDDDMEDEEESIGKKCSRISDNIDATTVHVALRNFTKQLVAAERDRVSSALCNVSSVMRQNDDDDDNIRVRVPVSSVYMSLYRAEQGTRSHLVSCYLCN